MTRPRVMEIDSAAALGGRLAAVRADRGLSLRQLAFTGCTSAYISTIEKGRRVPSLQVLQKLAERLDVSVDYLARGEATSRETKLRGAELAVRFGDHAVARKLLSELTSELQGRGLARVLALKGLLDVEDGEIGPGVDLLEQALQLHPQEFATIPNAVESLGRTYATRGEYETAITLFSEARDQASAQGDRPRALKNTVLLANAYIDLGDLGHSADSLSEALRGATELRDPMIRASVFWSQARLHTLEGRHDLAASFAERALEIIRSNEDERAVGLAHQTLAYIELERGNPQHALELLDVAAPLVARAGDAHEQASLDLDRARAFLALDQLDEARELLQEVAPLLTEHTGGDGGRCLLTLAELYDRLNETDDALAMYNAAAERLADHRNPHLVRALRLKGELLGRLGRTEEAYEMLKSALQVQESGPRRASVDRGAS